jgi:hypothetical protein
MTTHRLLADFVVAVPESQANDYRAIVADKVLTHPDSVKGLTPKLNWLLDKFENEDALLFLDDDLVGVTRCFTSPGESGGATMREPELIHALVEQTAQMAQDIGAKLFGWEANNGAIRYYTGLKPFMLTGYINGCAIGFLKGHGLRYDTRIVAKNDFDICAMNAYRHRYLFKNCRYTFIQKETFVGRGGQSAFRNSQTEKRDVALLKEKYGDLFNFGGFSGTRKRDYAGVQKISMKLPY